MQYIISGSDLQTIYNTQVSNAVVPFWQFPDRKASTQVDLPDQDGIDIDLEAPTFAARTMILNCVTRGSSIEVLKNYYFALFTLLRVRGNYSIYCDFVNMTVYCFYQKQTNLSPIFRDGNGYAVKFDLTFGETDPFANIPNIFLVDDQNRFLVP